jgi:N-methylhydantoinase B
MEIDSATLEVVRNATTAVAEEMNATLVRTSYSPNITDRRDCSCALFGSDGEMVAQAENIPAQLGAMPFSVQAALEEFPPGDLQPGDVVVHNDPFRGGAHLPDITVITPVFDGREASRASEGSSGVLLSEAKQGSSGRRSDGERSDPRDEELVAIAGNRAHHADVGGARAGSVAADSTEIYQEGIRIPPVKLYEAGEPNEAVFDLILANVRTPEERRGDLRAQHAANRTAVERVRELRERFGPETLMAAFDAINDYSERRMRAEIAALPDGTFEFVDVLDDDGRGHEDLQIRAEITVTGEDLQVDFAGSAPQVEGAINAPYAVTASGTYFAVRCLTDPDIPPNDGCYRPIDLEIPPGTVVNAQPPAAVVGGNLEVSQRVADVVLGALGQAVPGRATAAGQGTMNNVTFGGTDPRMGDPYAFYETLGGGFGGRNGSDGMDGVHVHMSNTLNTPVEVLETAYPLRVEQYALRENSGGPGEFRGGLGLRRDIRVRDHDATFSLLADRRRRAPFGVEGGEDGARGEDWLLRDDGRERIAGKTVRELGDGDLVSVRTPGGGGYGDPDDRDRGKVVRDVQLGKVSVDVATEVYGVDASSEGDE